MNKFRSLIAAALVVALVIACLFALCRPQCQRPTLGSWLSVVGPAFGWTSSSPTPDPRPPIPTITHTLVGTGDDVIITVPPNEETVRIRVDEKLHVVATPESSVTVVRRVPLIRFRPTVHVCALASPTDLTDWTYRRIAVGLKVRAVEVGRFGLAGYVTSKGPGVGLDCRLVGGLSVDAALIWRIDRWALPPTPMARTAYVGLSLRL